MSTVPGRGRAVVAAAPDVPRAARHGGIHRREAELVRVRGENHGINSKPSVEQLRDAIMLDWFEKYLKGRPDAWAARWSDAKR